MLRKISTVVVVLFILCLGGNTLAQSFEHQGLDSKDLNKTKFDWIQTARVFLVDAYQAYFTPELEYDAELMANTVQEMHGNVVRFGTMGQYSTIQGIRFSNHPDQAGRDLLTETIAACKPKGIRVVKV